MDYTTEIQTKLERVRQLMAAHQVDTLWLRTVNNVAWITGGVDVAINTADTVGVATVLITANTAQIVTNTIEGPRLASEDGVEARGFEIAASPWYGGGAPDINGTLGVDLALPGATDLSREISLLRARLLPVEVERCRALGRACANAMEAAIGRVEPGMTEFEIGGALANETYARGATPVVVLIASDERIFRVRHPLPTRKVMDRYAMLVLCGRTEGLVCSVTRLVHFGALSAELEQKSVACATVDARINAASRPGAVLGDLFETLRTAYADVGFADEWQLHHQGGSAGYAAREFIAVPGETAALEAGMICAWNPSITGTKVEDTILVTPDGPEILTAIDGWPTLAVEVNGLTLPRPLIKVID